MYRLSYNIKPILNIESGLPQGSRAVIRSLVSVYSILNAGLVNKRNRLGLLDFGACRKDPTESEVSFGGRTLPLILVPKIFEQTPSRAEIKSQGGGVCWQMVLISLKLHKDVDSDMVEKTAN